MGYKPVDDLCKGRDASLGIAVLYLYIACLFAETIFFEGIDKAGSGRGYRSVFERVDKANNRNVFLSA